jgi:hypothetical protein
MGIKDCRTIACKRGTVQPAAGWGRMNIPPGQTVGQTVQQRSKAQTIPELS